MHRSVCSSFRSWRPPFIALSLLMLTACGGGTTSDDTVSIDGITLSASSVDCGAAAYATATVSYDGDITSSDLAYSWTQTSGTAVTLSGSDTAKVYFTAPSTAGSVVLKLSLSANDVSDSASVSFTVTGSSCS